MFRLRSKLRFVTEYSEAWRKVLSLALPLCGALAGAVSPLGAVPMCEDDMCDGMTCVSSDLHYSCNAAHGGGCSATKC
jgi:hypothetical protein